MKKKDLFTLETALNSVKGRSANIKFSYAVVKNSKLIAGEIEAIREVAKPGPEFEEYNRQRLALLAEHAHKDENGNPLLNEQGTAYKYVDEAAVNEALKAFNEENAAVLEQNKQKETEVNALLDEEIELDFHKVGIEHFPNEISPVELESLMVMLAE